MEKLSRVKKYEDVRKNISTTQDDQDELLSTLSKRINKVDTSFKAIKPADDEHEPYHARNDIQIEDDDELVIDNLFKAGGFSASVEEKDHTKEDTTIQNILNEIREYNINRGNKSLDDTKIELLKKINTYDTQSTAKYVVEKPTKHISFKPKEKTDETKEKLYCLINDSKEEQKRLLDETQSLKLKLDHYEKDMSELNTGIDYTNKILNILMYLLILVVLIIGAVVGYLLWGK